MNNKVQLIEAILFTRGEPVPREELASLAHLSLVDLAEALELLRAELLDHGIALVTTETAVTLATAPAVAEAMKKMREEELSTPLSKGALETLTIILYKGPIAKSEIDYLRGVNSATMLRNLLVRGLVDREEDPKDKRSFLYSTTTELLELLGVTSKEDLPDFGALSAVVDQALSENIVPASPASGRDPVEAVADSVLLTPNA